MFITWGGVCVMELRGPRATTLWLRVPGDTPLGHSRAPLATNASVISLAPCQRLPAEGVSKLALFRSAVLSLSISLSYTLALSLSFYLSPRPLTSRQQSPRSTSHRTLLSRPSDRMYWRGGRGAPVVNECASGSTSTHPPTPPHTHPPKPHHPDPMLRGPDALKENSKAITGALLR